MLEKLYDWVGIASIILEHSKGRKKCIVSDVRCGTGRRLAYLKKLLKTYNLDIHTIGVIPQGATYESLSKSNLDEIIYVGQKIKADYVIMLDLSTSWREIDDAKAANSDYMLIYSAEDKSLHIPKVLSDEKNYLIKVAQKYHRVAHMINGKQLNKFYKIPQYESFDLLNIILKHVEKIKRKNITIVDAGCGSGYSALELKNSLEKNGITSHVIGIDKKRHHIPCDWHR